MSNLKVRVGQELLGTIEFPTYWTVEELYEELMKIQDQDAASENPRIAKMETFYLKIYGDCNKDIFKDYDACEYCPNNHIYKKYHEYNALLNKKDRVIILKSSYNDFRDFDIMCAYYTDQKTSPVMSTYSSKKELKLPHTLIELYGTKKTFWDKIKNKIFYGDLCV